MAIYGNRNTGEITPNNFATRPGVIPGKIASAPSTVYLFGSNLGILQEENNLSISKATIRSAIPRPFMLGASGKKKNIIDGVTATVGVVLLVAIGYNLVKDTIEIVRLWPNTGYIHEIVEELK